MKERTVLKVGRPSKSNKEKLIEFLKDDEEFKQVSLRLPIELHEKLKIYSAKTRKPIIGILIEQIEKITSEGTNTDAKE
jgi:hypothetical protein